MMQPHPFLSKEAVLEMFNNLLIKAFLNKTEISCTRTYQEPMRIFSVMPKLTRVFIDLMFSGREDELNWLLTTTDGLVSGLRRCAENHDEEGSNRVVEEYKAITVEDHLLSCDQKSMEEIFSDVLHRVVTESRYKINEPIFDAVQLAGISSFIRFLEDLNIKTFNDFACQVLSELDVSTAYQGMFYPDTVSNAWGKWLNSIGEDRLLLESYLNSLWGAM